ncbi:hypothetical protein AAG570_009315 [Ranatra chinensis]|uniref:RNA-directed DNA polymerase n=1 Tax=Ranatra chinensis TaxID=642074 RepID=A0ABD0YNP5_9HEMI
MDVIRQELKDLLDQGIIRKSISPYCSPIWVVPKPPDVQGNLRHRVVVNYKELNKHTRWEKYPLPKLEDMLDRMNGASAFSSLDLKAGYHQIRMQEADCGKTAFQFERGNYSNANRVEERPDNLSAPNGRVSRGSGRGGCPGDRPVAFASRKLTSAESIYSAIERELLGVVWAVEYFRPYLRGRQFLIKTDHKPLAWVGGLKETSARVARWKERLAALSPSRPSRRRPLTNGSEDSPDVVDLPLLEHPEGESSIIPGRDLLRRRVLEEPDLPAVQVPASRETPSRSPKPDRRNIERRKYARPSGREDKIGSGSLRLVARPRTGTYTELVEPGQTYYVYGDTTDGQKLITVLYETGLLAKGSVLTGVTKGLTIIEGEEEQRQLLRDYVGKTNHRGVRETVSHLRRRYYWPKMTKMVAEELARYEVCARAKYVRTPQETPQMVTPTPEKPLDVVEADLVFLDGAILVC